jgi:hypothetical protein
MNSSNEHGGMYIYNFLIFRYNSEVFEPESKIFVEAFKQIDRLFQQFQDEVFVLINNLQIGKGNLKYLLIKLDFNNFYSERDVAKHNMNNNIDAGGADDYDDGEEYIDVQDDQQ